MPGEIRNMKITYSSRGNSSIEIDGDFSPDAMNILLKNIKEILKILEQDHGSATTQGEPVSPIDPDGNLDENQNHDNIPETIDNSDNSTQEGLFPIYGDPMTIQQISSDNRHIKEYAWDQGKSIKLVGNQQTYRIVFPLADQKFNTMCLLGNNTNELFNRHSYPVCSCRGYHYNNSKKYPNRCKHVECVIMFLFQRDMKIIDWSKRDPGVTKLLKNTGLEEFQWVP